MLIYLFGDWQGTSGCGVLLEGRSLAEKLRVEAAAEASGKNVCLAVCLVGDDPASHIYVKNKRAACREAGISSLCEILPKNVPQKAITELLNAWNADRAVHGILVQLPLPNHVDRNTIVNSVAPAKDVDGFHSENLGRLLQGSPTFVPCTPLAVRHLLESYDVPLTGKHVVIINDTIVLGRPLAALLPRSTVTLCNVFTERLKEITLSADVIVSGVGRRPHFVLTADMVRPGSHVVDVGVSRVDGKVVGDVDFEAVSGVASVSPAVGGVGPLTVAFLLKNVVKCLRR